jgi:hypothetical protein
MAAPTEAAMTAQAIVAAAFVLVRWSSEPFCAAPSAEALVTNLDLFRANEAGEHRLFFGGERTRAEEMAELES